MYGQLLESTRSIPPRRFGGRIALGRRARVRARILPGGRELPVVLDRWSLRVSVFPVDLPPDGLMVTLEVVQDGCTVGAVRVKGVGALSEIPLEIRLIGVRQGGPGLVRVRSNAEVQVAI